MITKEVNEWIKKLECGMYTKEQAMEIFQGFVKQLTKDEIIQIKDKLANDLNTYNRNK